MEKSPVGCCGLHCYSCVHQLNNENVKQNLLERSNGGTKRFSWNNGVDFRRILPFFCLHSLTEESYGCKGQYELPFKRTLLIIKYIMSIYWKYFLWKERNNCFIMSTKCLLRSEITSTIIHSLIGSGFLTVWNVNVSHSSCQSEYALWYDKQHILPCAVGEPNILRAVSLPARQTYLPTRWNNYPGSLPVSWSVT